MLHLENVIQWIRLRAVKAIGHYCDLYDEAEQLMHLLLREINNQV